MPICVIFGAGNELPADIVLPEGNKYLIAADGGLNTMKKLGLTPDHIVGDLDSLDEQPEESIFTKLPHIKDTTDTFEAVKIGQAHGCTEFHIFGGTGGRFDHTLANIQLAAMLSQQKQRVFIYGYDYVLTAVTDSSIALPCRSSGFVSVFALSDICRGVGITGLMYELENAELTNTFSLGVSNEFIGKPAELSVKSGTLCIYYEI